MQEHEYKSIWTKIRMDQNPPSLEEAFAVIRQHESQGWSLVSIEPISTSFFPGDRQILVVVRKPITKQ